MKQRSVVQMLSFVALHGIAVTPMWAQSERSKAKLLDDPIFGITVNVYEKHYEPMPTRVAQRCSNFPRGKFWVFASYRDNETEYLVVSGFIPGAEGDPVGNVIVIHENRCTGESIDWLAATVVPSQGYGTDTSFYFLPGKGAQRTCNDQGDCRYALRSKNEEAVVRGLARNGLARGVEAWGERAFRSEACASANRASEAKSSQIFSEELENYCEASK